eukprot:GEMP01040238.1.p1 GENE.GEMP01040238.1~~GEMP01040238.1.p1  ORF type:complete len:284 (+),score=27.00 GEMP01040238.1:3-854(+)
MLPFIYPLVASHTQNALPIMRADLSPPRTLKRAKSEKQLRDNTLTLPRISSEPSLDNSKRHRGIWGDGPPRARPYKKQVDERVFHKNQMFDVHEAPATAFRLHYERGDIPIAVKHGARSSVEWKVKCSKLDYSHHLPIFIEGLLEKAPPYDFLAELGLHDMIQEGKDQIYPVMARCIQPIKRCLSTKDPKTICKVLVALQEMLHADHRIGSLLVRHYRQLLPIFRLFSTKNLNLGDGIEYSQRKRENLGDLIRETLELLEKTGGPDAFINIKYLIPTYESLVH